MTEREPQIGDIVHLRRGGVCYAGIITAVDPDNGTAVYAFHPPNAPNPVGEWQPYNSLSSARPTSGWHWKDEQHAD